MSGFMNKKLSSLEPYTPGEQPKNINNLIKLNTNESPFPPSPRVLEALSGREIENLRLYPDPQCAALIKAVADYHGVEPENVFPGNGSDEVLAFCFHGFCENGAAFADITYGFYRVYARMFGVNCSEIPLREDFRIAAEDYAGQKGTVFIANPNAPTGIALPLSDIEALLRQDSGRLVIVDEAYVEFGGESAVALIEKYSNLLVVRTFSKSHSLAGARLGYAVGPNELINGLNTLRYSFNPYNLNRLSILAGAAAIGDWEYFDGNRKRVIEARSYASEALKNLGFTVTDSRANFIFAGENEKMRAGKYFELLRDCGILVRYFPLPRIDNYVRISVGTMDDMMRLIEMTRDILEKAK